jgi:acyl carrier protein
MAGFISNLLGKLSGAEKQVDNGPMTEERIRTWLISRLAKQLKCEIGSVDIHRSFESYGLDSIVAVQVAGDLEKLLEQRLSPALLFEYQSIDDLSKYLAGALVPVEA